MVIEGGGGESWAIRAIPSAIPYFNLLILNVAQAVIAVFLASDFLKRDKKLDTTEVIYMRSMTNGEYVIGKTLGNMQVFMILNIAVVILALVFNALAKGTPIDWVSYGVYLVLISIPTLVFIMGLSFLLMRRNPQPGHYFCVGVGLYRYHPLSFTGQILLHFRLHGL